jgi:hypothetical protein
MLQAQDPNCLQIASWVRFLTVNEVVSCLNRASQLAVTLIENKADAQEICTGGIPKILWLLKNASEQSRT